MAYGDDLSILVTVAHDGKCKLRVTTGEGYNGMIDEDIGIEEVVAVADLVDQFDIPQTQPLGAPFRPPRRKAREVLRGVLRAQVAREESALKNAEKQAESIPERKQRIESLKRAVNF